MATEKSNKDSVTQLSEDLAKLQADTSKLNLNLTKLAADYPEAAIQYNPLDLFRADISSQLASTIGLDWHEVFSGLAWTSTLDKGDLTLPTPRFRIKGTPPAQLAETWAATGFASSPPSPLYTVSASGIYLRFDYSPAALQQYVLPMILALGDGYGLNPKPGLRDVAHPEKGRKKEIIEFSSPNIAKKFHAGHLRSTIIGGFLSNLFSGNGYDVVKMNYLGDWGRQYGLLALGWKKYGDEAAFEKDPISHLFDIYVKISADFQPEEDAYKAEKDDAKKAELENSGLLGEAKNYFKRMEARDETALELWRRFRALSIERYKETYARLNIDFSEYSGESTVLPETMDEAEKVLKEKGIAKLDKGAVIVDFKDHGAKKLEVAIIRNRNGTSNYLLRDIGSAIQRYRQHKFDEMIYVVMAEQEMHLKRLYKLLELMGGEYAEIGKRCKHVNFGKVMGMSTRKGTVKFLDDILEDVGHSMHDVMRKNTDKYAQIDEPAQTADTLGISAIMVQDMAGKRVNNYPFQIERMTSFEGDTGPYLQYAHARLCSITRKAGHAREHILAADFGLLTEPHAVDLLRVMATYPDMVVRTLVTLEPTTVLTYLFRLTHQLSSSYDVLRVINPPEGPQVGLARAALYEAARQVIRNGMVILGLTPVNRPKTRGASRTRGEKI